jgi:hypothetical protein
MGTGVAGMKKSGADKAAFSQVAERYRRRGDAQRALEICQKGLDAFPDHLSGRVTLGWALLDLGQYDEARAELELVLRRAPDNLLAIRGLAALHDHTESSVLDMEMPEGWNAEDEAGAADEVVADADRTAGAVASVDSILSDLVGTTHATMDHASTPAAGAVPEREGHDLPLDPELTSAIASLEAELGSGMAAPASGNDGEAAAREAEAQRVAAEAERVEAERAAVDAERIESERVAAEARRVEAERVAAAERDAAERIEAERAAADQAKAAAAERDAAEAERVAAEAERLAAEAAFEAVEIREAAQTDASEVAALAFTAFDPAAERDGDTANDADLMTSPLAGQAKDPSGSAAAELASLEDLRAETPPAVRDQDDLADAAAAFADAEADARDSRQATLEAAEMPMANPAGAQASGGRSGATDGDAVGDDMELVDLDSPLLSSAHGADFEAIAAAMSASEDGAAEAPEIDLVALEPSQDVDPSVFAQFESSALEDADEARGQDTIESERAQELAAALDAAGDAVAGGRLADEIAAFSALHAADTSSGDVRDLADSAAVDAALPHAATDWTPPALEPARPSQRTSTAATRADVSRSAAGTPMGKAAAARVARLELLLRRVRSRRLRLATESVA